MRILILANNDGGLFHFRKELLEALLNEKHEVIIALPNGIYISEMEKMGCQFHEVSVDRRGVNPFVDLKLLLTYKRLIKELKPNIVFTYTIKPNVYGGIACQICHIPYLVNVTGLGTSIENGGLLQKITLFLYRKGLQGARKVFFQNRHNMNFMISKNIISEKKSELLPGSGVNLEHFKYTEYPSEENGIHFLFVGRIMKDKGIEELLVAFQNVKKEFSTSSLTIVGDFDGPYKEWIDELEKNGIVIYLGVLKDVRPEIAKAHCIVLPSYHEGMANVLLEASAMGRPVIATDVPGCRETFEDGVSGVSCKVKDSDSLEKALKKFLSFDIHERQKLGMEARMKIQRTFDRNIVIEKYLKEL